MAIEVIPKEIQDVWNIWNLRVAVLFSLFFQILLFFVGSARKRSGNILLHIVIWSCYLLADWVAAFAVGLISNSQGNKSDKVTVNGALVAFWAPFLLLHIGGPDTITAFSLEDNELWLRHMLNFVVQVLAVAYVFTQSIPNQFWLPTLLVFLAGTTKYAERIRALYLACLSNFKNPRDVLSSSMQLVEKFNFRREARFRQAIQHGRETRDPSDLTVPDAELRRQSGRWPPYLNEIEIIQYAYLFSKSCKDLIGDFWPYTRDSNRSRIFFLRLSHLEAFKIMEVELNFIYDELYTKMAAVHNGIFGYMLHFVCTCLIVAAFMIFISHHKPNVDHFDIVVTYALLVSAVVLEFIALVKLVFSMWTIALLEHSHVLSIIRPVIEYLKIPAICQRSLLFKWTFSGYYMYQHSLISFYLRTSHNLLEEIVDFFALKEGLHSILYKRKQHVDDRLLEFIFNEVKDKAAKVAGINDAKAVYSARGGWTLDRCDYDLPESIKQSVKEHISYGESILMWHIATEICCSIAKTGEDITVDDHRTWCKQMSDYLLYLAIMQPKFMSSVSGISLTRFQEICEEIELEITSRIGVRLLGKNDLESLKSACSRLLELADEAIAMHRSKFMPTKALIFSKHLLGMANDNPRKTWEMMSKVWVELLCYGASHCRGDAYAQQLRQGRELITFFWLLMAHFGLQEQIDNIEFIH